MLLVVAGAGALWASSALNWAGQRYRTPFTGETTANLAGADVRPELVPFALAALAAIAAVLATGGWLRRLVGVLVAVAGGALAWRSFAAFDGAGLIRDSGSVPGGSEPIGALSTSPVGPLVMTLGGLVLAVAGLLVVVRARRMPAMGAKYSAPGADKPRAKDPDRRLWDALDAGADPTADDRDR